MSALYQELVSRTATKLGIAEARERRKPFKVRLYCLRKWFMNNTSYEGFDHTFKEFWLGHTSTQINSISRERKRHREEYAKAYENLRIYKAQPSVSKLRELFEQRDRKIEQLESDVHKYKVTAAHRITAIANILKQSLEEQLKRQRQKKRSKP